MATINLFGASGHAKVVMDIVEAQGDHVGVLYDDAPHCTEIHGCQVLKASDTTVNGPLIISIGYNKHRKLISEKYPVQYATAMHSKAIVAPTATIGSGSVVMHGAIIQSDARIGRHCIINTGASVDHECRIGDFVHISPHTTLCGNVNVGEGSWIGAGAIVIPGIKIGKWCTVGAGAVVIKDIPDGATAVGNPVRIVEYTHNMKSISELIGGVILSLPTTWLHKHLTHAA